VYYHIKDVRALSHEPLLVKFREFRAFMKKLRKAAGKNDQEEAARMETFAPSYTLHHLVRERYPRFSDALSDLDDALALIYLFAALPSQGRIKTGITKKAMRLAAQWGAYVATTSSVTKSFVSVKGIYMEAEVQNCVVRWVIPHSFTQSLPKDVDFRVMTTFFEFYETLLGFVLYKLYGDLGVRYPLPVNDVDVSQASSGLAVMLGTLERCLEDGGGKGSASSAVKESMIEQQQEDGTVAEDVAPTKNLSAKERKLLQSVDSVLQRVNEDDTDDETNVNNSDDDDDDDDEDDVDIATPLMAALKDTETTTPNNNNPQLNLELDTDALRRKTLFTGLTFFLSREIPKGYISLVCLSYGGRIGWDGPDSPIAMGDKSITHHIVDRPKLPTKGLYGNLPKSREFVQPQWILDSANFDILLPTGRYGINGGKGGGGALPPHLSPWVDDDEEGYKPAYAEEIALLKSDGVMAITSGGGVEEEEEHLLLTEDGETNEKEDGSASSSDSGSDNDTKESSDEEEDEEEEDEDDEELKSKLKADVEKEKATNEEKELAKGMMSKKASRLYGRMQHGIAAKQSKVDVLHRKRKEIEVAKKKQSAAGKKIQKAQQRTVIEFSELEGGQSISKAKVERLRGERRTVEKKYEGAGETGSMKKKKRKTKSKR